MLTPPRGHRKKTACRPNGLFHVPAKDEAALPALLSSNIRHSQEKSFRTGLVQTNLFGFAQLRQKPLSDTRPIPQTSFLPRWSPDNSSQKAYPCVNSPCKYAAPKIPCRPRFPPRAKAEIFLAPSDLPGQPNAA